MLQIKLPDGSIKEYPDGARPREVAAEHRQAAGRGGRGGGGQRHGR